jgi:hypothetical protein
MSYFGWEGKKVRNVDGRTGTIVREVGLEFCSLAIRCDDGSVDLVVLNCLGADYGSPGWKWWCPTFVGGPAWVPLGENGGDFEYDNTPEKTSDG